MEATELLQRYSQGQKDFSDISITGNLQEVNLSKTTFTDVIFHEANFENSIFKNSIFKKVNFESFTFEGVNFKNANLQEVYMQNLDLENANFQESILIHAQLQNANLKNASLQSANLADANFRGADLCAANLTGANIRETNFDDIKSNDNTLWESLRGIKQSNLPGEILEIIYSSLKNQDNAKFVKVNNKCTQITLEDARKKIKLAINQRYRRRSGQETFRQKLLEAYGHRCAITGCEVEKALEAAHIVPYCLTQENDPSNGIILRADLHTLFDFNMITIEPTDSDINIVCIEKSLQTTDSYREFHKNELRKTINELYAPQKEALIWRHKEYEKFLV